jgi:hypothetical protein
MSSPIKNTLKLLEPSENKNLQAFIYDKINYLQEIIRKTIISIKQHKKNEIFSNNDVNLSITVLTELYSKTKEISKIVSTNQDMDYLIELLQKIVDKLSMIICGFGTLHIEDLLFISFGSEFKNLKFDNLLINSKYELIQKYIRPIGYKIINWKKSKPNINDYTTICSNKISDTVNILDDSKMCECFDTDISTILFYHKVYGIRVVIQNEKIQKTIIINGIIDDVHIDCFTNKYIDVRLSDIMTMSSEYTELEQAIIRRIMQSMTLKDILIYGNEDIHKKMIAIITEANSVKNTKIDVAIKKFMELELYSQRSFLINLITHDNDNEIKYICYLLYELITVNNIDSFGANNQLIIYDSLPWKVKEYFKDVVKYTIKYTNDIVQKYDIQKISLEQQVYLLKVDETVKQKAMTKIKEIKGKSDEMCIKTRQYLEGLIKIPFGIYREEPILNKMKDLSIEFKRTMYAFNKLFPEYLITNKLQYTNVEIYQHILKAHQYIQTTVIDNINNDLNTQTLKQLEHIIHLINLHNNAKKVQKNKPKPVLISIIIQYLKDNASNVTLIAEIYDKLKQTTQISFTKIMKALNQIASNSNNMETNIKTITDVLDDSIHGHAHAKNQIMKIIGQWINGENSGYCFGFEGSPGVGKTSLANKGISKCLVDAVGASRPFTLIAVGGSSNGSVFEGHGYTYVNSTWGKLVDVLMDSKCMNPIIYIDELDKVSKTENGKEIIGLLTHLTDPTQNNKFQDKYFSGIDLDLSKILFIFSYNDPDLIDSVLLDRIHRIKFENLTLDDKLIITKKHIIPDINKKLGFDKIVELSDDVIEYIINTYTSEPGVRKLKELLFDLYGEINLEILKCNLTKTNGIDSSIIQYEIPVIITKQKLENKYLEKYPKMQEKKIHTQPLNGIINGLWANAMGRGGIIPIQSIFFPSSTFLELKLTGLQGDVMKESMNVAKTLAWKLTPDEIKTKLIAKIESTKCQGLHVHCPEGAVAKDGPSAGAAITCAMYSVFNNLLIKNDVAITGEINLNGEITAIGGLPIKISGGIRAGITTLLYPKSNNRDFLEWKKINKDNSLYDKIQFVEVSTIEEVFKYVFV